RGITHSIPAIIIWGILIPLIIYLFVPEVNFLHLWLWTFLAVFLHVFVDVFNAYVTQAFRPFSHKWVAYWFINTFDMYIFFAYMVWIMVYEYVLYVYLFCRYCGYCRMDIMRKTWTNFFNYLCNHYSLLY